MGSALSVRNARKSSRRNGSKRLLESRSFLEEEITQLRCKREQEIRAYKREAGVFLEKQAKWRQERKMWKSEVRRLRRKLIEKDEIIAQLEDGVLAGKGDKEWQTERMDYLVEHLREEQARREEAVEKWKRLYMAIKTELDNLVLTTCRGERLRRGQEEDELERLQKELKTKEETVQELNAQIRAMEDTGAKREKELDILRQSLRIVSNSKRGHVAICRESSHPCIPEADQIEIHRNKEIASW